MHSLNIRMEMTLHQYTYHGSRITLTISETFSSPNMPALDLPSNPTSTTNPALDLPSIPPWTCHPPLDLQSNPPRTAHPLKPFAREKGLPQLHPVPVEVGKKQLQNFKVTVRLQYGLGFLSIPSFSPLSSIRYFLLLDDSRIL